MVGVLELLLLHRFLFTAFDAAIIAVATLDGQLAIQAGESGDVFDALQALCYNLLESTQTMLFPTWKCLFPGCGHSVNCVVAVSDYGYHEGQELCLNHILTNHIARPCLQLIPAWHSPGAPATETCVNATRHHMKEQARHYLHDRVATSGWPGGISSQWLDILALLSERWVGNIARFAVLRWAVNEEDDEWLQLRSQQGTTRQVPCATCGNLSCAFPLGGQTWAQCEGCIAIRGFHALNLPCHSVPTLDVPEVLLPGSQQKCVACHQGDNTGHWTRWCPVPVLALRNLLQQPSLTSVNSAACLGGKQTAVASRTIHHFRMMLRESGAMRHMTADRTREQHRWVTLLVQKVFDELPIHLRFCERPNFKHWRMSASERVY